MPVVCFGPICVPMNLFLPFLVGLLHRYGYLQWFKPQWVTLAFWKVRIYRFLGWQSPAAAAAPHQAGAAMKDAPPDTQAALLAGPTGASASAQPAKDELLHSKEGSATHGGGGEVQNGSLQVTDDSGGPRTRQRTRAAGGSSAAGLHPRSVA